MRRRDFITLLGSGAAAWPVAARAQQGERVRRIGVLMSLGENDPEGQRRVAALLQALRLLGWTDGRNIRFDFRWAPDSGRLRSAAAELLGLMPEVLMCHTTTALQALEDETRSVPIVFVQLPDPATTGLIKSLANPGGNATGFVLYESSIAGKWVELLKEAVPSIARILVLTDSASSSTLADYIALIEKAAPPLGVAVSVARVSTTIDIDSALDRFSADPNGSLIVMPTVITLVERERITARAESLRLPAIYPHRYFAASGGLLSYGIDNIEQWHQAASYVDRILKGAKPADLPVQLPTKYDLIVNLKTARAIGLTIPDTLLVRADEVIE
jgi:putative ABC transport system substrate-binding protein